MEGVPVNAGTASPGALHTLQLCGITGNIVHRDCILRLHTMLRVFPFLALLLTVVSCDSFTAELEPWKKKGGGRKDLR